MLKVIADFFNALEGSGDERETLGHDRIRLATATLLFHAIAIDGEADEKERAFLRRMLRDHFALDGEELAELLEDAEKREREAVDIYRFTSVLRDRLSQDEKREIVAMMWRLAYADGELAALEDNLIWRTAELLAVPTRDRMELKKIAQNEAGRSPE